MKYKPQADPKPTTSCASSIADLTCWVVVDDGKVGTENQCLGLAEALGFQPVIKRVRPRGLYRWLPASLWLRPLNGLDGALTPPWPDLIIAGGRVSVAPTAAIRARTGGTTRVIQMQNPRVDPARFDLVIAPCHDQLRGANVIETAGSLHRVTHEKMAAEAPRVAPLVQHLARPLVAVLIGGSNQCYDMTPEFMTIFAAKLKALGAGLAITCSRRTSPEARLALVSALGDAPYYLWDGQGENPYMGLLGLADACIVTSDSVAMTSEACFTGKPVYTAMLPGGNAKFNRFHALMQKRGHTRLFEDTLSLDAPTPLDDYGAVLPRVRDLLADIISEENN